MIYNNKGKAQEIPMEIHVESTDSVHRHKMTLVYGEGEKQDIRPYELVTIDASNLTASFGAMLEQNEQYGIFISAGSITDEAENLWQGLGNGDLSFTASNEPPGSNDDSATVEEDGAVSIAVLDNDEDLSDGLDLSTLRVEQLPLNGIATVNTETGEITYVDGGYNIVGIGDK